jgi:hypothetical protein
MSLLTMPCGWSDKCPLPSHAGPCATCPVILDPLGDAAAWVAMQTRIRDAAGISDIRGGPA